MTSIEITILVAIAVLGLGFLVALWYALSMDFQVVQLQREINEIEEKEFQEWVDRREEERDMWKHRGAQEATIDELKEEIAGLRTIIRGHEALVQSLRAELNVHQ